MPASQQPARERESLPMEEWQAMEPAYGGTGAHDKNQIG